MYLVLVSSDRDAAARPRLCCATLPRSADSSALRAGFSAAVALLRGAFTAARAIAVSGPRASASALAVSTDCV